MAQVDPPPHRQEPSGEEEEEEKEKEKEKEKVLPRRLRRLEFVKLAAARVVVCLAGLYGLAKGRAGPTLRPTVDAVEWAVARTVVLLCGRFRGTPLALLVFLDRKVDDMVQELERKLPRSLTTASSQACTAARGISRVAREVLAEARRSGVASAGRAAYVKMKPAAKFLYLRYGPAAGRLAVSTWRSLNRLPLFPQAAQIAARWTGRYNGATDAAAPRGNCAAEVDATSSVRGVQCRYI